MEFSNWWNGGTRPQFYRRTGRTGGDNPDTEGCVVGALCEKYAQQQFHGGRGAGAYRPDSPDEGLRFGVRGEGPARNTCDGRPGTERPVGGECRHIGYLCTARCAGIGTGQLLGTCRRTAATQRGARRPRRRGLSAFVPAGTGGQAYSVCSGDRAYGRTGPYPKGGDTRRG